MDGFAEDSTKASRRRMSNRTPKLSQIPKQSDDAAIAGEEIKHRDLVKRNEGFEPTQEFNYGSMRNPRPAAGSGAAAATILRAHNSPAGSGAAAAKKLKAARTPEQPNSQGSGREWLRKRGILAARRQRLARRQGPPKPQFSAFGNSIQDPSRPSEPQHVGPEAMAAGAGVVGEGGPGQDDFSGAGPGAGIDTGADPAFEGGGGATDGGAPARRDLETYLQRRYAEADAEADPEADAKAEAEADAYPEYDHGQCYASVSCASG